MQAMRAFAFEDELVRILRLSFGQRTIGQRTPLWLGGSGAARGSGRPLGEAGERQVENARIGLTHVIGLGSACGIHILEKV